MEQEKTAKTKFTQQDIEHHLQSALAAATPDIWPRLEAALKEGKTDFGDIPEREGSGEFSGGRKVKGTGVLNGSGRAKQPVTYSRIRRWGAAAAACVCLFGAGGWYHYQYIQVASQVEIDVNPSLKLSLNRKERVVQAQALNDDGERLMEDAGLKGKTVRAAVDQVVDSLIEQGYLEKGKGEHAVLVSVSGKTPGLAEQVKAAVTVDMETVLAQKEVEAVVYDQVIRITDELEELAEMYQVSLGKAEFIGQLVQENPSLSENRQEAYSRMMSQTMEELSGEIDRNSYQVGSGVTVMKTEQADSGVRERDKGQSPDLPSVSGDDREERAESREKDRESSGQEESAAEKPETLRRFDGMAQEELSRKPDSEVWEGKVGKPVLQDDERQPDKGREDEGEEPDDSKSEDKGSGSEATRRKPPVFEETDEDPVQVQGELEDIKVPGGEFPGESETWPEEPEEAEQESAGNPEESGEFIEETDSRSEEPERVEQESAGNPEETGEFIEETDSRSEEPEGDEQESAGNPEESGEFIEETDSRSEEPEGDEQDPAGNPEESGEFIEETDSRSEEPEGDEQDPAGNPEESGEFIEETDSRSEEPERDEQESAGSPEEAEKGKEFSGSDEHMPVAPGDFLPDNEDMDDEDAEDEEEVSRIIRTAPEADTFEPGDITGKREEGLKVTGSGTRIIFEAVEEKRWKEPVYASQFLTGSQRNLLQMGPGVFFDRILFEDQEELLQLGPGFACLYGNLPAGRDESYLWGVRVVSRRGNGAKKDKAGAKK